MINIVIAGGGTAGWMTAAALSSIYNKDAISITLIESEEIGTIGVGEASIPHLKAFNARIGLSEKAFLQATNATFKLGIQFENWGTIGNRYLHPFEYINQTPNNIPFHHITNLADDDANLCLDQYLTSYHCAQEDRFALKSQGGLSYAYHLDASSYAKILRKHAESRGITRIEGRIVRVIQGDDGNISQLKLTDGQLITGDLFIDCSGFRGLLIKEALQTPFIDWSQWLICDAAVAAPSYDEKPPESMHPYTRAIARHSGWQWEIPLRNRRGNGLVFNTQYLSIDEAEKELAQSIKGKIGCIKRLRFKSGVVSNAWNKNCVSIGLSSGFLEPLESTSIYLIQAAITNICDLLTPALNEHICNSARSEFNNRMEMEYLKVRDFIILHYAATQREDSEFWRHHKYMELPDSLQTALERYTENNTIEHQEHGLFLPPSWHIVFSGQGVQPTSKPPANQHYREAANQYLAQLKKQAKAASFTFGKHINMLEKIK